MTEDVVGIGLEVKASVQELGGIGAEKVRRPVVISFFCGGSISVVFGYWLCCIWN